MKGLKMLWGKNKEGNINVNIDDDLYKSFEAILTLEKKDKNTIIEDFIKNYVNRYNNKYVKIDIQRTTRWPVNNDAFYGKAKQKVHLWARKTEQYNHKIIRAFFTVEARDGTVSLEALKNLSNDSSKAATYVPTFNSNYENMKRDNPQSHGKVFEDNKINVWLWPEIEETLRQYKSYFYNENE